MAETLTRDEVSKHTSEDDIYIIIDHKVYDLSDFILAHPGGSVVLGYHRTLKERDKESPMVTRELRV